MIDRYPEPELPIRPILSFASFSGPRDAGVPSVEDVGRMVWVTSGRIAIALGLQCEDVGAGDEVLLPAYNCSTTVDAVEAVGAKPVFYKSHADLSPDMDDIEAKITEQTRALLIVHFFGFSQEVKVIRQFCHVQDLILVEDCAHAYFGQYQGCPLGSYGDFAVISAVKFFPLSDGGGLIFSAQKKYDISLHSGGTGFEIKSIINNIERSVRYRRFRPVAWLLSLLIFLKDGIWSMMKRRGGYSSPADSEESDSFAPSSSYGGYGFDSSWMNVRMSRFSRFLIRWLPRGRIVKRRRENFSRFLAALSDYPNAQPLFRELPEGVVPYVFPLLVSPVERIFPVLKMAGVPILRWEDIDTGICEISSRYSVELLQFPCHHEINDREMSWMIDQIQSALSLSD